MKTITRNFGRKATIPILAVAALSLTANVKTFAIEGLQISVQCSNVVLSWPSAGGQNYIVQYRSTLDPSTPWQTVTNSYPGVWTTNVTVFVHSNIVQNPCNCGGTGSFSTKSAGSMATSLAQPAEPVPMVMPSDGSAAAVPLALYPPGFNLTGFVIVDPIAGETLNGAGYSVQALSPMNVQASDFQPMDGPMPPGGASSDGQTGSVQEPETGFYQVVQDGVRILDSTMTILTNGFLAGTVNIGFEAGNADPNNGTNLIGTLSSAVLLVDGVKFPNDPGVSFDSTSPSPRQFAMDTAYLENGGHTLQVEVFWFDPNGANDGTETLYPSRISDPVSITVSNIIYYPQWEEDVAESGTNATYFLKTTCIDADWSIDIFDVSSNFVQRLTGHTDDGTIEAYWNMIDSQGVARTNADIDPQFSAIVTVADPATATTPPKKHPQAYWPDHGGWTCAYLDYFRHFYSQNNDMLGHINAFTLTAQKYGGYLIYYPPAGSTNDVGQTYPLRYYDPNHSNEVVTASQIAKDSALLKSFLSNTNCRNFFYRGHAGPQQLGYISASDLANVIKHRYRFVLLQACNTADGALDKAFGINGPGQYDLTYYQKSGRRPATFVGNHGTSRFANWTPGASYDGTIPWQVPYLYYNFLFYWDDDLMGEDFADALWDAINDLPLVDNWGYDNQPGMRLKIYGYPFLHIDEYNHRADWP